MHTAQAKIAGCPLPPGSTLIGYIDRHPADPSGLGYAILIYPVTGVEVAWDGETSRALPKNWRSKVTITAVDAASVFGSRGGRSTSDAKAAAAKANGAKGGRPRKVQQ